MKNPLLDALRQTHEKIDDAEFSDMVGTAEPGQPNCVSASEDHDLELLESTDCLDISSEADELTVGDVADAVASSVAAPNNEIEADSDVQNPMEDTSLHPMAEVTAHRAEPALLLIGRYSPLLSVLLISTAAGGYSLYHKLKADNLNTDLAAISSQLQRANSGQGATQDVLAGPSQRFSFPAPPAESRDHVEGPQREVSTRDIHSSDRESAAEFAINAASSVSQSQLVEKSHRLAFEDDAFAVVSAAYAAYIDGHYSEAESSYRRALSISPRHPSALEGLAALLQKTQRVDESLEYYEMLLALDPGNTAATAALLAANRDLTPPAAESALKLLIQRHPISAHLQFALGTHFASESRWPDARLAFATANRLDAANADYLYNLAITTERLGQLADAGFYYQSALAAANADTVVDTSVISERLVYLTQLSERGGQFR